MKSKDEQCISCVDDEPKVLQAVGNTLRRLGRQVKVSCFCCAADCLAQLRHRPCDLLITDVKMSEMDGIELLAEAKRLVPTLPVLVMTGFGDIPMAVRAMKAGASDFIEKPLERSAFLSTVRSVLKQSTPLDPLLGKTLTRTEIKVLRLILDCNSNKEVARLLHRSVRTIEDHRGNIMHKLGADNIIDLVRKVAPLGIWELPKDKDNRC